MGWYLLLLMATSVVFSGAIYEMTTSELGTRLERFQHNLQIVTNPVGQPYELLRENETDKASANIIMSLLVANMFILVVGGVASYLLARHTLKPIKESHEAQSRFTSDASHELRTPLAAMKTEIEVALRDKKATTVELKDVMKSALEEVDKLSRLSQMLLDLSRLDHNKLSIERVDLPKITKDVIDRYAVPKTRVRIRASKKTYVVGNEAAITELVSILVDNALKYSLKKSLITISISTVDKKVIFEITNAGDGIAPDKLPHIFDRFYRADTSRTNRNGYGLGLFIAKRIIELSHGEISVTSTAKGLTTFSVSLPRFQKRK